MKRIKRLEENSIGFPPMKTHDDSDKAKAIIAKALNIDESLFESRYSDFFNGHYWSFGEEREIMIYNNDELFFPAEYNTNQISVICKINNAENCNKIIEFYNQNYIHKTAHKNNPPIKKQEVMFSFDSKSEWPDLS